MNLLARKRQLVIAKQGADLLRKKKAIGVLRL
jgi:vacuolar-type H+-ATPase subunit D/Vma8